MNSVDLARSNRDAEPSVIDLDPAAVAHRRFPIAVAGYRRRDVEEYLDSVSDAMSLRDEAIGRLRAALSDAPSPGDRSSPRLHPSQEAVIAAVRRDAQAELLEAYRRASMLLNVLEDARARFEMAESAVAQALRLVMERSRALTPGEEPRDERERRIVLPADQPSVVKRPAGSS